MAVTMKVILLSLLFIISPQICAKEVHIGLGNFEPYFISESKTGLFKELLDLVFTYMPEHTPVYHFDHSNNRLFDGFKSSKLDALANIIDAVDVAPCYVSSFFHFQDVAISRKEDQLKLDSISDLNGKSIITFQGARVFYGEEFLMQTQNGEYVELANPGHQVRQLARGVGEVSVGDLFIFLHNLDKVSGLNKTPQDFNYHNIIPKNSSRLGFKDTKLCEVFEDARIKMESEGSDIKIYNKYFKKYHAPEGLYFKPKQALKN